MATDMGPMVATAICSLSSLPLGISTKPVSSAPTFDLLNRHCSSYSKSMKKQTVTPFFFTIIKCSDWSKPGGRLSFKTRLKIKFLLNYW